MARRIRHPRGWAKTYGGVPLGGVCYPELIDGRRERNNPRGQSSSDLWRPQALLDGREGEMNEPILFDAELPAVQVVENDQRQDGRPLVPVHEGVIIRKGMEERCRLRMETRIRISTPHRLLRT